MSISDLRPMTAGGGGDPPPSQSYLGRVARTPTSDQDNLIVVIPDFSQMFPKTVPPGQWIHGSSLPPINAQCLVVLDENDDAWVPLWSGYAPVNPVQTANVGDIKQTAAVNAPAGWLLCNGAAISRTTYSALFAAIGTTYGAGDGSTTFNVPNLVGRVPVGAGTGYALGSSGGEAAHALVNGEMPVHSHGGKTATGTTGTGTTGTGTTGGGTTGGGTTGYVSNDHTHTYSGTTATQNQNHNHGFSATTAGPGGWPSYSVYAAGGGTNFVYVGYSANYVGGDGNKYNDLSHTHTLSGTTATEGQGFNHNYSGTTSGISANHTHTVPGLSVPGLSVPGLSVPGLSVPQLTISNDGGGGTHNNMQPYLCVNHVIKF